MLAHAVENPSDGLPGGNFGHNVCVYTVRGVHCGSGVNIRGKYRILMTSALATWQKSRCDGQWHQYYLNSGGTYLPYKSRMGQFDGCTWCTMTDRRVHVDASLFYSLFLKKGGAGIYTSSMGDLPIRLQSSQNQFEFPPRLQLQYCT